MRKRLLCLFLVGFCLLVGCQPIPGGSLTSDYDLIGSVNSTFFETESQDESLFEAESALLSSEATFSEDSSFFHSEPSVSGTVTSQISSAFSKPSTPSSMAQTSSLPSTTAKPSSTPAPSAVDYSSVKPINGETKAVWISQFDLQGVLKENGNQRPKASFTTLFRQMLGKLKDYGFNTVFLQARPYSDSFYPSQYFPWSDMVVSAFGKEAEYDPYAVMVTEARKYGFSVHGWINPLRGMTDQQLQLVDDRFPIKKWYNDPNKKGKNIVFKDNRWYYNSSVAEVRELIANGAKELLKSYQLDGIHIDDYFYYSTSLEDVSKMVQGLYQAVKSVNPQAQFGVSPEGSIERDYSIHFADVRKWCSQKGYLDYICPQIYYGLEHETHDFAKVVADWNGLISKESGVYLLAGMTLGKAGNIDSFAGERGKKEWQEHNDIIKRCIIETRKQSNARGFSIFCYQYLFDPITGAKVERTAAEVANLLPELKK